MRSKITRIIVTGGILTLVTVGAFFKEAEGRNQAVVQLNRTALAVTSGAEKKEACQISISFLSQAANFTLFGHAARG